MIRMLAVTLSLLLVGGATPTSSPGTGATSSPTEYNRKLIFISAISGDVEIKRNGNTSYQKVYVGTLLNPSDRLKLGTGASVQVLCDNLQPVRIVSQGESLVSEVCPSALKMFVHRVDSTRSPTRNGANPNIPYLMSPRTVS